MKPTEFVSRKPGQHEEQDRLLRQLLKEQEKQRKAMEKLVAEISILHTVHDVRFSWPMDHELMQLVRAIHERLAGGGGLTESQEQELAAKLSGPTDALQSAVEANQPNPTEVP